MTVSMFTPKNIGYNLFNISWTSTVEDATFYVYMDSLLYIITTNFSINVTVLAGEFPVFEVFDTEIHTIDSGLQSRQVLSFYRVPNTSHYLIQEFDSSWTTTARVDDFGQWYFTYTSAFLDDTTLYRWRVLAVGTDQNLGTPRLHSAKIVRTPNIPTVDYTFDGGTGEIEIDNV